MVSRPDVLVLGGGGVLGEAWMMGVLAGIEEVTGFDLRRCEYFVGTSAGSIVASHLVAGDSPRRPASVATDPGEAASEPAWTLAADGLEAARRAGAWALAAAASFAPLALGLAAPGGALMRRALLDRLPRPRERLDRLQAEIARLGARFDGRLRVVAVDRGTGRRVVFGSPGAPPATVAEAVAASCTIPWLFAPVEIGGRDYVDGGVWSPTNMDAAPAGRGAQVLCLNPTATIAGSSSVFALFRSVSRSAAAVEELVLRQRGASVQRVAPSAECAAAMGANLMDGARRERTLAGGYRQGVLLARQSRSRGDGRRPGSGGRR